MNRSVFAQLGILAVAVVAVQQSRGVLRADGISPTATNAVKLTPEFFNVLSEEMRTNHPALGAGTARITAAEANAASVRTWEDPMVMLGGMGARTDMRMDEGDIIYGVEQPLPLFGKPKLMRRMADSETATEKANLDYQFQLLRRDLVKAAVETALGERVVAIGQQDLAWLDTVVANVEQRYLAAQASQVDLLRIQNERSKRVDQLRTDEVRRDHFRVGLNRLLNRNLESPWPVLELPDLSDPIPYSQKLVDLALRYEPRIKVLRHEIKEGEAATALASRRKLPDVSVGLEARNYSGDGSLRQGMVLFRMNLPIGNRGKYRKEVEREQAKVRAAELDLTDYALSVREEIHDLTVRIDAARREALLQRTAILPRSEQALRSALASWQSGRGMFLDILEARRMLLEAQLMEARAIAEQYTMLAELVLCCGLADLEAIQIIFNPTDSKP